MKLSMRWSPVIAVFGWLLLAGDAPAQSDDSWRYQVGGRSTFMLSTMHLADLGGGFEDLPAGGGPLAHSSSLFILWPRGTHGRLGVETLVGNSYSNGNTDISFQAAGVTGEYQTAGTWFVAMTGQVGGMIASATQSVDPETEGEPLRAGVHYKGAGFFVAPQFSVGRRFRRYDVRLIGKRVWQFGEEGLEAFNSAYAGISVGLIKR
jgi:hypothetical protein